MWLSKVLELPFTTLDITDEENSTESKKYGANKIGI